MLQRIRNWYRAQNGKNKLLVAFLFNFCMWLFIQVTSDLLFPPEHPDSIAGHILKALFTAVFWTLIFDWKKVKEVFRKGSQLKT